MKKLIVFDLDGTLAESKSPLDPEMSNLLNLLLRTVKVAVISGGDFPQYERQFLSSLAVNANQLRNLYLLPTCGTKFYRHEAGVWKMLYAENFTPQQKHTIINALTVAMEQSGFKPQQSWGPLIEDRGSQITFSALGQEAPVEAKKKWDADFAKRKAIKAIVDPMLPEFAVRMGGATSIDVTKQGIDKAHGIKKLRDVTGVKVEEMLFVGDALFPGGNDYPVKEAGVYSVCVRDHNETKRVIETVIGCLS